MRYALEGERNEVMNKFYASVGVLVVGATGVYAQYAPGLNFQERSKPWSVSASLRGFYDDNVNTSHTLRQSSWGVEVSPSASIRHSAGQTFVSASYVYDAKYYTEQSIWDQSHQFNAKLDHKFSERYKLLLNDSFVVAQEPSIIDTAILSSPLRTKGDNIRNTASADFTADRKSTRLNSSH